MKTIGVMVAVLVLAACGGVKTRTPDEWKKDVGQGFEAHAGELKACYDNSGLKTKVSVTVRLAASKQGSSEGGSSPIHVEGVDPGSTPAALVDCVKQAASSIAIRPEDTHEASGTWVVTFDPDAAPSAAPKS